MVFYTFIEHEIQPKKDKFDKIMYKTGSVIYLLCFLILFTFQVGAYFFTFYVYYQTKSLLKPIPL